MKKFGKHENGRTKIQTIIKEESLTQQQFAETVDANNIVAKYQKTGEWTHLRNLQGTYADLTDVDDYATSLNKIKTAHEAFDKLPSDLRLRFGNDPVQLLQFIADPRNQQEGEKLGLYKPAPYEHPTKNEPNDKQESSTKEKPEKVKTKTPVPEKLDD